MHHWNFIIINLCMKITTVPTTHHPPVLLSACFLSSSICHCPPLALLFLHVCSKCPCLSAPSTQNLSQPKCSLLHSPHHVTHARLSLIQSQREVKVVSWRAGSKADVQKGSSGGEKESLCVEGGVCEVSREERKRMCRRRQAKAKAGMQKGMAEGMVKAVAWQAWAGQSKARQPAWMTQ